MQSSASAPALSRPRHLQVLTAIFMTAILTQPLWAGSNNQFGVRIDNFGQISPIYYRGAQPDLAGFAQLKHLGVKAVINLREDPMREEASWVRNGGMLYFHIPLTTSSPATSEQTEYFLKLVNDPQNWPVYVHCKGGKHRAGEMTAIYRITHDSWTADQAYQEMKRYKFYSFPFQGSLVDYVYQYYDNFKQSLMAGKTATSPAESGAGGIGIKASAIGGAHNK
jgi:protein tyrosine/serine phosphatase